MAAKITHLEIYRQSLVLLEHGDEADQKIASTLEREELFRYGCAGAVAPDIFYYYHLLSPAKHRTGMNWGNRIHHRRVFELVLAFLDRIRRDTDEERQKKRLAFALGYISHCAADIVTHPYIFYITGNYYSPDPDEASKAQENHLRVENILDAYLVYERWGISPERYNFLKYVDITEQYRKRRILDFDIWQMWVNALSVVYPEDFGREYPGSLQTIRDHDLINDSFLGFLKFNRIVDTRSKIVRGLLRTIDTVTFHRLKARNLILPPRHKIDDRYPNTHRRPWRFPANPDLVSTDSFHQLVHRAAEQSADWIRLARDFVAGKKTEKDFKPLIGYNLDTGTITDSTGMFAFEPIPEV
jgi:hypothetical protein